MTDTRPAVPVRSPTTVRRPGVRAVPGGIEIGVHSLDAERVEVCIFGPPAGARPGNEVRMPLRRHGDGLWSASVSGVEPGTRYGFRVYGPNDPDAGLHFDPANVLLDPYARAIASTPDGPRSLVVDERHDWAADPRPAHDRARTVVYEAHVRGLTARHPDVPENLRGTYAGLAHPAVTDHLRGLGITTLELLPVHAHADEPALTRRGLTNYWGYNTLGFFAPHAGYAAGTVGSVVTEFKDMVRALHAAGIEVILDVVYNHTAEGDPTGPTTSLRGIDNRAYYRLDPHQPARYADFTGCGNTLDLRGRPALRLVVDSLRYWVEQMHVDGFRFDLAPALARRSPGFDPRAPLLDVLALDPVLAGVTVIAEPWDAVGGGYQLGGFGAPWSEWNDRFRDDVRDFWRGAGSAAALSARLAGSSDVFGTGRGPTASVNFITSHDGFTLADLVSYEHKQNAANGEHNRDGTDDNRSSDGGAEGPSDDPAILAARRRRARNLLATLLLSAGVPMILGGDEIGRTQHGNNNAYCQDNELSYLDWTCDADRAAMRHFTARLIALRERFPVLRSERSFTGEPEIAGDEVADVAWFSPTRQRLSDEDWPRTDDRTLGMFLGARSRPTGSRDGDAGASGEALLLIAHADDEPIDFALPGPPWAREYDVLLDTAEEGDAERGNEPGPLPGGATCTLAAGSLILLRARSG